MWLFNIVLALVFGLGAGIFVVWRGKVAIRDRYITNSAKSALFTGVTHYDGEKAVQSGKLLVVMGFIMAIGSGLGLLGVAGIACLMFILPVFGGSSSDGSAVARGPDIEWVEDEFGNEAPVINSPAEDIFREAQPERNAGPRGARGGRGGFGGGAINPPPGGSFFDDARQEMERVQQESEQQFAEMQRQTEREMEQMDRHFEEISRQQDQFFEDQRRMIAQQFGQNRPGAGGFGPGGRGFGALRNIGAPGSVTPPRTIPRGSTAPPANTTAGGSSPGRDRPAPSDRSAPSIGSGNSQLASGPVELGTPPAALPVVSFDERKAVRSHQVGFSLASGETIDDPPEGGVMVGMIVGVDTQGIESIQNVQAVYQVGNAYFEGQVIGQAGGRKEVILAPEGHAVYGLEVQSSTGIDAIRLGFMPMDERGRLKRRETQVSQWVGNQGSGGTELVDGGGKVIIAVYGAFTGRESLAAIGLFAADKIEVVEGTGGLREWKSADGQYTIRASYVSHADGVVKLLREDGNEIDVQIDALRLEDQDWIDGQE